MGFTSFGDLSVDEEDGQQEQWQYPRHVCHLMAPTRKCAVKSIFHVQKTAVWRCPIEYSPS